MTVQKRSIGPAALALTLALAGLLAAGCGTPAVVKPVAAPLSGLSNDVQAARNAVAQSQAQAQAATGATLP